MSRNKFCPRCASQLTTRSDGGRDRPACPDTECGYFDYGVFTIGCSGVVVREEAGVKKILIIQRGQEPFAGTWQLPGGYAEHDETISLAVEREIMEESGVQAKVSDVVGFRHMPGHPKGGVNNIYMIFRLEYISGEPRADGDETAEAAFFTVEELAAMDGVQNITRWGIEHVLATPSGSGLSREPAGELRPGWQVFGLTDVDTALWSRKLIATPRS